MRGTAKIVLAVAALGLVAGACGGDDDGGDGGSGGDAADVDATGTSADAETGGDDADASDGEPWTEADLEALIATEVDGYEASDGAVEFGAGRVRYLETAPTGPVALEAAVTLTDCDPFLCFDLDAEPTEQQLEGIRSALSRVHIDNPDLVAQVETEELAPGATAFTVYFLSFVAEGGSTSAAHRFTAIHHDGANIISIDVRVPFTGFDGIESAADLEVQMDRERALEVASDVFAAYADEFDG